MHQPNHIQNLQKQGNEFENITPWSIMLHVTTFSCKIWMYYKTLYIICELNEGVFSLSLIIYNLIFLIMILITCLAMYCYKYNSVKIYPFFQTIKFLTLSPKDSWYKMCGTFYSNSGRNEDVDIYIGSFFTRCSQILQILTTQMTKINHSWIHKATRNGYLCNLMPFKLG